MQCQIEVAKQSLSTQCKPLHSCAQTRTLHRGRRFRISGCHCQWTRQCLRKRYRNAAWHQRPTSTRLRKTDFASVRRVRRGGGSSGVVADVCVGSVVSGVRLLSDICSHWLCVHAWCCASQHAETAFRCIDRCRTFLSTLPECRSSAVVSSVDDGSAARFLNAACRSRSPRWLGADGRETETDSDAWTLFATSPIRHCSDTVIQLRIRRTLRVYNCLLIE